MKIFAQFFIVNMLFNILIQEVQAASPKDVCDPERYCLRGKLNEICCGRAGLDPENPEGCSGRTCAYPPYQGQAICFTCGANECVWLGNNPDGKAACLRCCEHYCTETSCQNDNKLKSPYSLNECKKSCKNMVITEPTKSPYGTPTMEPTGAAIVTY
ncbi:MAG: hypothetical protein GYA55_02150 [SAR324 cluster bacterium]|uniref:Uncharacterized protein n=1 Tax=SAR324 cluster bacterium TaxID=2024889 RepID=A0A7X9IKG5_9DELT|nr:hypothetical protein [SAR324 cluster bacterium]